MTTHQEPTEERTGIINMTLTPGPAWPRCSSCAALRQENERLREGLGRIADMTSGPYYEGTPAIYVEAAAELARQLLQGTQ